MDSQLDVRAQDPRLAPELDEEELVGFLERDQLVSDKTIPVPRAILSFRVNAAMWVLRVFVLVVGVMVIYTFVSQLS